MLCINDGYASMCVDIRRVFMSPVHIFILIV